MKLAVSVRTQTIAIALFLFSLVLDCLAAPFSLALDIVGQNIEGRLLPTFTTAVALNVTVVNPSEAGFLTVYPCSAEVPLASNLNFVEGDTVANSVIAPVGTRGKVCFYSSSSADLIVDIAGTFSGDALATLVPKRLLDTRGSPGNGKVSPENIAAVPVTSQSVTSVNEGLSIIPTSIGAAVLNVTAVNPSGPGFLTVFPCGEPLPLASSLNFSGGDIVANSVVIPLGTAGEVCIYSSAPTDVVVDISGWIAEGGFEGVNPQRLVDTRELSQRVTFTAPLSILIASTAVGDKTVPVDNRAVSLNLTAVGPSSSGYLTAWPCSSDLPLASNLNYVANDIIANGVITQLGASGDVCIYSNADTDVVVDIAGWFSNSSGFRGNVPLRLLDTREGLKLSPNLDSRIFVGHPTANGEVLTEEVTTLGSRALAFKANWTDADSRFAAGGHSLLWEFGDGAISREYTPVHQYPSNGEYIVKVTIEDNLGGVGTAERTILVEQPRGTPENLAVIDNRTPITLGESAHEFFQSGSGDIVKLRIGENQTVTQTEILPEESAYRYGDLLFDAGNRRLITLGRFRKNGVEFLQQIYSVNIDTGERSIIYSSEKEFLAGNLEWGCSPNSILALGALGGIFEISLFTGQRTWFLDVEELPPIAQRFKVDCDDGYVVVHGFKNHLPFNRDSEVYFRKVDLVTRKSVDLVPLLGIRDDYAKFGLDGVDIPNSGGVLDSTNDSYYFGITPYDGGQGNPSLYSLDMNTFEKVLIVGSFGLGRMVLDCKNDRLLSNSSQGFLEFKGLPKNCADHVPLIVEPGVQQTYKGSGTFGTEGGVLNANDLQITLEPGDLGANAILTVKEIDPPVEFTHGLIQYGKAFDISVASDEGLVVNAPLTITVSYDDAGLDEEELLLPRHFDGVEYRPVTVISQDLEMNTITFESRDFSPFALFAVSIEHDAADSIPFFPSRHGWAMTSPANPGSYWSPGGSCLGMAGYAAWHYKYEDSYLASSFNDDVSRIVSIRAQLAQNQAWTRTKWRSQMSLSTERRRGRLMKEYLDKDDEPLVLLMGNGGKAKHAGVVYGYDKDFFFFYDVNFKGESKKLPFDGESFGDYSFDSGNGQVTTYTSFGYTTLSSLGRNEDFESLTKSAKTGFTDVSLINLSSPTSGSEIAARSVEVSGNLLSSDSVAVLYGNGESRRLNLENDSFTSTVELGSGSNTIAIFAGPEAKSFYNWYNDFDVEIIELSSSVERADLLVGLTWLDPNADKDLDLYVYDPDGKAVFWQKKSNESGLILENDARRGPGPEYVSLVLPDGAVLNGDYTIRVHYYGLTSGVDSSLPVPAEVFVILNEDTPERQYDSGGFLFRKSDIRQAGPLGTGEAWRDFGVVNIQNQTIEMR